MALTEARSRTTVRWTSGVNVVLGLWLIAAPFILGYGALDPAVWNDVIIGLVVLVLAGTRVGAPLRNPGVSWVNVVLGVWLILAPFILGYGAREIELGVAAMADRATWNDIIVGVIVAGFAAWSVAATRRAVAPEPPPRR